MNTLFAAINSKYVHTNLAVRYLTSYCIKKGIDCEFEEYTINEPYFNVLEKLYMKNADIYAFSCYIWNIDYVLKIAERLKMVKKDCKILLGGPEVSFDAENILKENEFIDYIVCGEGEITVSKLLSNPPDKRLILHGEMFSSLDEMPFPYTDEDLDSIVKNQKLIYYETSRGCPFRCSYCLSSIVDGVRYLSLERAKSEIKKIASSGVQTIKFVDRTFNADKRRAKELWEFCGAIESDTKFHFEIGADLLDDELLEALSKIPKDKFQLEIGVQSTNIDTISAVSRSMDLERLKYNVRKLREFGNIHLHLDLIAGLPKEDYKSFSRSFNDVYSLRPNALQLVFLKLLKGSRLRYEAESYNAVYNPSPPYEVYSTDCLGFDDIIRLRAIEDVLDRYYNSERFTNTLEFVVDKFNSPFEFYESFSDFWCSLGLIGQGVKRIKLYDILFEFLKDKLSSTDLTEFLKIMKTDFSKWHSNGIGTPDWYKKV